MIKKELKFEFLVKFGIIYDLADVPRPSEVIELDQFFLVPKKN